MEEFKQMVEKFEVEFDAFESRYDEYVKMTEKIKSTTTSCQRDIKHYRAYLKMLKSKMDPWVFR